MDPRSKAPKQNASHGMRCYRKILHISFRDHVTNEEVRAKIQQAAVVWSCLLFIRSGQNHLARHCERGKKTRQTGGKTTSGNGQAWSSASPRGQWKTGKNGGKWLRNHLWCPNDPRGGEIDNDDDGGDNDDDDDDDDNVPVLSGHKDFPLMALGLHKAREFCDVVSYSWKA